MRPINNIRYTIDSIKKDDIFICAFGYEKRSFYLFEKVKDIIQNENILILYFNDFKNLKYINILSAQGVKCVKAFYNSGQRVQKEICSFIDMRKEKCVRTHIDYSSMPRNWYYNLPLLLEKDNLIVHFWYVVGKYPMDYTGYPTAGIDTYTVIGKPSLRIDGKRLHVFGLSYDAVRTKALISEIDPEAYITCNAFDLDNRERGENVNILNQQVRSRALNEFSFYFDDFSFMFSKLCEIANEYLSLGSVIFVPDGPKPLIFAMSLVSLCLCKEGISCLHVYRNEQCLSLVDVEPTDSIVGFSI